MTMICGKDVDRNGIWFNCVYITVRNSTDNDIYATADARPSMYSRSNGEKAECEWVAALKGPSWSDPATDRVISVGQIAQLGACCIEYESYG
jgi:hypothetical protein